MINYCGEMQIKLWKLIYVRADIRGRMLNMNRIADKFHRDFADYKNISIGIYGIGNNAKAILQDVRDFDVAR